MKKTCEKGHTLEEMLIVGLIFSFFLLGIYTVLDSGIKSWNIGQTRTDLQGNGEILLKRIVHEISLSSKESIVIDTVNKKYIAMETACHNNEFKYDPNELGCPIWQGYIIYYLHSDKKIYRRFEPLTKPNTSPVPLMNVTSYLVPPSSTQPNHKIVASNVDKFKVERSGSIINITLACFKHISPGSTGNRFSVVGVKENAKETLELISSVEPKN